jgi:hypothetical protein
MQNMPIKDSQTNKLLWQGRLTSVQPRILPLWSFDQRHRLRRKSYEKLGLPMDEAVK